jgi:hypothetical protein
MARVREGALGTFAFINRGQVRGGLLTRLIGSLVRLGMRFKGRLRTG